jgi:hypothetical protein
MNWVELRGFEPLTSCMPYRPGPSPDRARSRPACRLAAKTFARCGLMSPGACRHWLPTWLPVNSLAMLTTLWFEQKAGQQTARTASSRTLADDRTGEDPPSDGRAGFPGAAQPDPARAPIALPRARAVIIDDELDQAAADSAPLPRLNSPEGHAAQGPSARPDARSCRCE